MQKIVISAPGKIHLSGEHAVVYGKPAVLAATSQRLFITLSRHAELGSASQDKFKTKSSQKILKQVQDDKKIENIKKQDNYLGKIISLVEKKYKTEFSGFTLSINSTIPLRAGMGSSAALAVALVAALSQWLGKTWNPSEVNELAHEAEKIQHGNASGSDTTISTFGGLLWYRREFDFLKTFWLLPFKIPKSFPAFIAINTGRFESAKASIAHVARLPENTRMLLVNYIEQTTKRLVQAIHDENKAAFQNAMRENEHSLEDLGVVSSRVIKLIREVEKVGGAAKISGAGGTKSGSGIVLVFHDKAEIIQDIAKKYQYETFPLVLGGEGVKREQIIV